MVGGVAMQRVVWGIFLLKLKKFTPDIWGESDIMPNSPLFLALAIFAYNGRNPLRQP